MSLTLLETKSEDRLNRFEMSEAMDKDQWETLSASLREILDKHLPPDFPGLSDYAVSREGIYADHP